MAFITLPRQLTVDINGEPRVGARLYVYNAGTNNTRIVYTTKALNIELDQPVPSAEGGIFPAVYVNPAGGDFKIVIQDADGSLIYSEDNIPAQLGATDIDLAGVADESVNTPIVASLKRTPAEISAGVMPLNYAFQPSRTGQLNVFRFFSQAQIESCIAQNGLVDHTLAIQAANDFLEGRIAAGTGGAPTPGGTLFFPGGLYNINPGLLPGNTLRVGGNVRWLGDKTQTTCLNSTNSAFGGNLITLGPDQSGFWPWNNIYTVGTSMESLRISLFQNNAHGAIIASAGAHQFCHLQELKIEGVNQIGISLGGAGGPAYTWIRDVELSGGTSEGLPSGRVALYHDTGSILDVDIFGCEGLSASHLFSVGIIVHEGSLNAKTLHFENTTDGVYFPSQTTPNTSTINDINGNSTVTNLIHIANPCNQTIIAQSIMGLTGDPSHPVGILNDVTGEASLNRIASLYSWSGETSAFRSGSLGYSAIHNSPHIRYGKSGTQAIAQNTVTVVTFPTKVDDWQSVSEWSGSVYTPKVQGRYKVTMSVALASTAWTAGAIFRVAIRKNGTAQSTLEDNAAVGTFVRQLTITDTVFCNGSTDTIDTTVFQGITATLNTDSSSVTCFITIDRE